MQDIQYLQRKDLDDNRWNGCITTASNGLIYGYTYYLDALCSNWDALVLNDYEAVMPLPWRKKYSIYYLYQPPFCSQLGLFGNNLSAALLENFFKAIPKKFRYWDFPLNHNNVFKLKDTGLFVRTNFVMSLEKPYEELYANYRDNLKRNIKKAESYGCKRTFDIEVNEVLQLAKEQNAAFNISDEDIQRFESLYHFLHLRQQARTVGVYSAAQELIASCVFTFSHNRAYYILVGNHPNGRTLGASHSLIDTFIKEYANQKLLLDFEGGDLRNLAFFYSGFGAKEEQFSFVQENKLPWYLKWLKK